MLIGSYYTHAANGMSHVKLTKIYTGTFAGRWTHTSAPKLEALHSFETLALG